MPSGTRQAPGRSSSILTKPSGAMRLFPISTFAPTVRQSSAELGRIARDGFPGRVTQNMTASLNTGRRC